MPKKIPGYTYVRCQIPPDVAAVYNDVARALDWNKPAVHMAALCYVAQSIGAENFTAIVKQLLARLEAEKHAAEFSDAADAADAESAINSAVRDGLITREQGDAEIKELYHAPR
jgi:hypothetical protein